MDIETLSILSPFRCRRDLARIRRQKRTTRSLLREPGQKIFSPAENPIDVRRLGAFERVYVVIAINNDNFSSITPVSVVVDDAAGTERYHSARNCVDNSAGVK